MVKLQKLFGTKNYYQPIGRRERFRCSGDFCHLSWIQLRWQHKIATVLIVTIKYACTQSSSTEHKDDNWQGLEQHHHVRTPSFLMITIRQQLQNKTKENPSFVVRFTLKIFYFYFFYFFFFISFYGWHLTVKSISIYIDIDLCEIE